jgi:hypothetical protein
MHRLRSESLRPVPTKLSAGIADKPSLLDESLALNFSTRLCSEGSVCLLGTEWLSGEVASLKQDYFSVQIRQQKAESYSDVAVIQQKMQCRP